MAAKDYNIYLGTFRAYIAKTSKRNPNLMTDDRREIPENEILCLIDWYLSKRCDETGDDTIYISANNKPIIEMRKLNFKKEE